jgi:hypothetical protein
MYRGKFEAKGAAARAGRPAQPRQHAPQPQEKQPKKKRGVQRHTVVFYSLYVLGILAFCIGVHFLMGMLDGFLVKYEASQPDVKSQEVFNQLFADPDWSALYELADIEDTAFDGKASFVGFMENKVGQQELSFVETSMGLSQDKKFYVRLGEQNVASFSLTNKASAVAIPEWELAEVEVYTAYEKDVTIHSYPGYTVKVNGVALGEQQVIRTTTTQAEQYLPEGLHGPRSVSYYLDGLMVAPTVTVTDAGGAEMTLVYDEAANAYSHATESTSITTDQQKAFANATQAYGRFMIADLGKQSLARYFTGNSYNAIIQAELAWMQDFASYEFGKLELTEYYAYSESWCSARVHQILYVTRGNGTVKEYEINSTFFLEKREGGWMVVEMTNANVQAGKSQVRLRFMLDGQEVGSQMVDANTKVIEPPVVTAPEGKVLAGWFTQSKDENGKTVMSLAFQTNDFGEVFLPDGYELEPMTVHALFEKAGAQ